MHIKIFTCGQQGDKKLSLSHYDIAVYANKARDSMNVRKGVIDIFKLLEENGYQVFRYPLGEDSILGASAFYGKDKVIVTNSSMILAREIYSAAHELGHHQLHLQQSGDVIVDYANEEKRSIEKEADYFAACFLMPKHILNCYIEEVLMRPEGASLSGFDVATIQSEFNVSFDSVIYRLQAINAITGVNRMELENEKERNSVQAFLKAINGNLKLLEKSETKYMPQGLLRMAIENHERKVVPSESLKKIFDAFDISAQIEEIENTEFEETTVAKRKKK